MKNSRAFTEFTETDRFFPSRYKGVNFGVHYSFSS